MNEQSVFLKKQAADCLIVKEIKFGQVRTQNIIDGKAAYTTTKDIKRLGYADTAELIDYLKAQGYEEVK